MRRACTVPCIPVRYHGTLSCENASTVTIFSMELFSGDMTDNPSRICVNTCTVLSFGVIRSYLGPIRLSSGETGWSHRHRRKAKGILRPNVWGGARISTRNPPKQIWERCRLRSLSRMCVFIARTGRILGGVLSLFMHTQLQLDVAQVLEPIEYFLHRKNHQ